MSPFGEGEIQNLDLLSVPVNPGFLKMPAMSPVPAGRHRVPEIQSGKPAVLRDESHEREDGVGGAGN